ncbi:hypothetical protein XENTR_v10021051 [Xenopus tropicalis]|nr:hypothetical protein XENTR_v10021051 [Xenopus tropicalis]KAE8584656.1 hypothetical protein XENTR_v10021051 [Xenopus tropicalis]
MKEQILMKLICSCIHVLFCSEQKNIIIKYEEMIILQIVLCCAMKTMPDQTYNTLASYIIIPLIILYLPQTPSTIRNHNSLSTFLCVH